MPSTSTRRPQELAASTDRASAALLAAEARAADALASLRAENEAALARQLGFMARGPCLVLDRD
jgi:hypothetical protein